MKRLIALSLSALAISTCAPTFAAESVKASINEAPVYFNGEEITEGENYPFLNYNGVIYMPLTFENADRLGLETNWSDEVGLNVSSDGVMYEPDMNMMEIKSLVGMPLSDLERKFATEEKKIIYSGGLEMGADGYVTDNKKVDPFALDADFLKYYCIKNNRVHATEYSSYDLRGSSAGEAFTNSFKSLVHQQKLSWAMTLLPQKVPLMTGPSGPFSMKPLQKPSLFGKHQKALKRFVTSAT